MTASVALWSVAHKHLNLADYLPLVVRLYKMQTTTALLLSKILCLVGLCVSQSYAQPHYIERLTQNRPKIAHPTSILMHNHKPFIYRYLRNTSAIISHQTPHSHALKACTFELIKQCLLWKIPWEVSKTQQDTLDRAWSNHQAWLYTCMTGANAPGTVLLQIWCLEVGTRIQELLKLNDE